MKKQDIIDYVDQLQREADIDEDNITILFWVGTNNIKEMLKKLDKGE